MNRISTAGRVLPVIFLPALLMVACSQPPSELVGTAHESERMAVAEGAQDYAPEAMAEVAEARAALEAELAVQEQRWGIRRSYDQAEQLAEAYRATSLRASVEAGEARDAAHAATEQSIADSQVLLAQVRDMIAHAPVGKGSAADLAALRADLDAAEDGLDAAQELMLTEKYLEAQSSATSSMDMIDRVRASLDQARLARAF
jgi:hypothetical protein